MIKGARKEMIVVRTSSSRYFDEAYFVLRDDAQKERRKSADILGEANRILAQIAPDHAVLQKKEGKQWIFFGIGGFLGAALSVVITLMLV
jgi:hypothetical protein